MQSYLKRLAHRDRAEASDRHLAFYLTFIAGAANAGGYMAVQQYTSHMSGVVSAMADDLVLGEPLLFLSGLLAFSAFVAGAAVSALLINWGRRRNLEGVYAVPLAVEAGLLMLFGLSGLLWIRAPVLIIVMLLCFLMGLQNAIITKLSGARIRTTHITGLVTDIGIEIGKALYWNRDAHRHPPVVADLEKLLLLGRMVAFFFVGGVAGAILFRGVGVATALLLALPLALFAIFPLWADLSRRRNERINL